MMSIEGIKRDRTSRFSPYARVRSQPRSPPSVGFRRPRFGRTALL